MQQYLASFIYYTIVLLIPLKQTYLVYKKNADEQTVSLWANYWAIYCCIAFFTQMLGFLTYQPFTFIFMIVLLWCYHSDYKGALFISHAIRNLVKSNPPVANAINMLYIFIIIVFRHQKAKFLNLFENEPAIQDVKVKTQ